jgi:PAS domain S-box-containing protein
MKRVLLVDDRQENLEYLSALLRGAGFEVEMTNQGEEALRQARMRPPDAVISDLLMPIMDGYSLLRRWRADEVLKKIPFLVFTATYSEPQDQQLAFDLGADAILIKPQEPEAILRQLGEILDRADPAVDRVRAQRGNETAILRRYNDTLFRKLQNKTRRLEESNRELLAEIFERGKIAQTQIAILNALPAHIALIDSTGMIVAVNEAWRRFAAANVLAAPDFGVGQSYLSVCESEIASSAEGASGVSEGLRAVLEGNAPAFDYEYTCDSPSERRWFHMMATPLHSGRSSGAVVMHIDVSDRKGVEQMLRESQEQYLLLLNSTAEGIYGLDLEGVCTFCNPAAARLLGFQDPVELLGQRVHKHHSHAEGRSVAIGDCRVHAPFRYGEDMHGDQEVFFRKDGSQFPVEFWSHPIRKEARVIGAVVTFLDISERRNLEAQFLQSQKMEAIGRLAGGVAHDFNNALQVVMTCSEMLDDLLLGRPLESGYVKEIQAASQQGAWLTRHLLAFSRNQLVRPVLLDLNVVVAGIEAMLRRIIGADITLTTNFHPDVCGFEADAGQVEQILMNLVVNARDAMPHGGELCITTSIIDSAGEMRDLSPMAAPRPHVLLSVRDSGCGMNPYSLSKLFEPFFTTKEAGKGTGLGLSTVYGIVKQHGGYIEVDSKPEQGTTFLVYFPATAALLTKMAQAPPSERQRGGGESILLVEDEKSLLSMVGTTLRAHGYKVREANTGVAGISLGDSQGVQIDLLVTDVILPDLSGPQVAERLLQVHPAMKVLFISGYTDDYISYPAVVDGETLLLEKPFSIGALLTRIREALDRSLK